MICAVCLGFLIRRRRQRARRKRLQEELAATAKPRRQVLIQHTVEIPPGMAERFRRKDECIRATLGDAYAMHTVCEQLTLLPQVQGPSRRSFMNLDAALEYPDKVYTPTITSRLSMNKLKMAVDWMRPVRPTLPKPGVLKNQASKPNLAPRKLVKHGHQLSREILKARPLSA